MKIDLEKAELIISRLKGEGFHEEMEMFNSFYERMKIAEVKLKDVETILNSLVSLIKVVHYRKYQREQLSGIAEQLRLVLKMENKKQ